MRSALFGDFTQCRMVVSYWHFGTTYCPHLQGSSSQEECSSLQLTCCFQLLPFIVSTSKVYRAGWLHAQVMYCLARYSFKVTHVLLLVAGYKHQRQSLGWVHRKQGAGVIHIWTGIESYFIVVHFRVLCIGAMPLGRGALMYVTEWCQIPKTKSLYLPLCEPQI